MTMHLIRGMTSLNTRKPRAKSRPVEEYQAEFNEHNKQARRDGMPQLQFKSLDEYIAYREGNGSKVNKIFKPMKPQSKPSRFIRETPVYPSKTSSSGTTGKVMPQQYSGDYMVGIATMHKSNLTPVSKETDPAIFATMRR